MHLRILIQALASEKSSAHLFSISSAMVTLLGSNICLKQSTISSGTLLKYCLKPTYSPILLTLSCLCFLFSISSYSLSTASRHKILGLFQDIYKLDPPPHNHSVLSGFLFQIKLDCALLPQAPAVSKLLKLRKLTIILPLRTLHCTPILQHIENPHLRLLTCNLLVHLQNFRHNSIC